MASGLRRRLVRAARPYLEEPMRRVQLLGRLMHPYWRFRFYRFGKGSIVYKPAWLNGAHKIEIGSATIVFMCWLSVERPAWRRPGAVVSIGDRVAMRPYTTISAAESVTIEDDVGIGAHSLIMDNEHVPLEAGGWNEEGHATLSRRSVGNAIVNSPMQTAPIRIGRGTLVGERVAVLRGAQIGEHCIIGTNSVVRGEIPAYSVAVGAPARVVGSTRSDPSPTGAE